MFHHNTHTSSSGGEFQRELHTFHMHSFLMSEKNLIMLNFDYLLFEEVYVHTPPASDTGVMRGTN